MFIAELGKFMRLSSIALFWLVEEAWLFLPHRMHSCTSAATLIEA
jgi:hypothetical protein